MTTCANCGAPLGVGRYCTNCGHRVGVPVAGAPSLHDTAERPAVPPAAPAAPESVPVPPVHEPPPPARFPLFADEPTGAPSGPDLTLTDLPAVPSPASTDRQPARRAPLLLAVGLVVLVAVGGFLLTRGGDDAAPARADDGRPGAGAQASDDDQGADDPADGDSPDADPDPTDAGSPDPEDGRDLSAEAQVTAPPPGPPSSDVATGRPVTYVAANMLDGDPTTCWRTPGDATGAELVFTLPPGSTVTSVSLINGYAKTSRAGGTTYDWYQGNRRILRAEWTFDDGTTISQDLIDTRDPQRLDVGAIATDTVRLRLVQVSPPGTGPAAKDNTAISEVSILGR